MSGAIPPMKFGWLRKQSRSGLIKNWQSRYFVLQAGKLSYYQDKRDSPPYGENLKGDLDLTDATLARDPKKFTDKQFFVVAKSGQNDMLMEADSAFEAKEWIEAIITHIQYASGHFSGGKIDRASTKLDRYSTSNSTDDNTTVNLSRGISRTDSTGMEDGGDSLPSMSDIIAKPTPQWVIKALRTSGEKIFINLCDHPDVPMIQVTLNLGYNKWPFMILTPSRTISEEKDGGEVTVYDAVVSTGVITLCNKDPSAKDATCLRVMRLLKKKFNEDLQSEYKLPKINKKYKGEFQEVRIPSNITQLAKTRSSVYVSTGSSTGTDLGTTTHTTVRYCRTSLSRRG